MLLLRMVMLNLYTFSCNCKSLTLYQPHFQAIFGDLEMRLYIAIVFVMNPQSQPDYMVYSLSI